MLAVGAAHASPLSDAAASLQPGESVKVKTHLSDSVAMTDGATFLMWGSSGVWDPTRREVRYVGKRYSLFPHRFLVYSENSDSWSSDRSLPGSLTCNCNGHGYDHNTIDPTTGTNYYREYNSHTIYKWNGSWSEAAASLRHGRHRGQHQLGERSRPRLRRQVQVRHYNGSSWQSLGTPPAVNYHAVSEYNPTSNTLIYGGGNGVTAMWKLDGNRNVSRIKDPPFGQGASETQTVLVSDPASDAFITWQKRSTNWAAYDVGSDSWSTLQRSTGDGSTPSRGAPNLSSSDTGGATIGIPISTYGVIMFIQFTGGGEAGVWVYKHSPSAAVATPNPPSNVTAE